METKITAKAINLIVRASENIITIADDIKGVSQHKIEITNGVDYSKESALKMINDKSIATKWVNTIDENGNDALVIVLEKGGVENENN